MFSAADLLEALRRRRMLKSIRPEEPGRMPPGWERWLEAMPARGGAVTGAAPVAFIDLFLQRPPRSPPRRSAALGRWQAFATLWRQQWHPPLRDERGLRIAGMATSVAVHACFALLLAWLMHLHFLVPVPTGGEPAVVQVEFIGTGTPDEAGGGPVPPERQSAEPAAAASATAPPPPTATPAAARPSPADEPEVQANVPVPPMPELPVDVAPPALATAAPPVPVRDVPTPVPPVQPLQVTEVARPDIAFVLPPPTPPDVQVQAPELVLPSRDVPTPEPAEADVEAPLVAVQPARRPEVAVDVPDPRPVLAVPSRQVPTPEPAAVARLPTRAVAAPVVAPAPVATRAPDVAVARIPAPPGAADAREMPAAGQAAEGTAPDAAAAADDAAGRVADAGAAQPGTASAASASASTAAGAGPEPVAAPGGWPSPTRGDDWDDALRNRPGGAAGGDGLFDRTGRPQLAGTGEGSPPGGAPPGSEARQAIDLERGGTWLQRPPLDHRPTRFDAFWIPTGTLLEEWVRRGVKQMSIPIPGTSMEIVCVVSVLQLGGGCGLSNPNVNEQPSSGRPPPDVPFKPELHEDQDSLARPPGG